MPRKKTIILDGSRLRLHYHEKLQLILKRMKRFPTHALKNGRLPPKLPHMLTIFSLGLDLRNLLLGSSRAAQKERLRLVKLMLDFPEFTIAAIYSFYLKKPRPATSLTRKIQEYLLDETLVILPDGKRVSQVGASDYELAAAIAKKYGIYEAIYHGPDNEQKAEKFVNLVKKTRQQLEAICGEPVSDFVNFIQKISDLTSLSPRDRAKGAEQRRKEIEASFYTPH